MHRCATFTCGRVTNHPRTGFPQFAAILKKKSIRMTAPSCRESSERKPNEYKKKKILLGFLFLLCFSSVTSVLLLSTRKSYEFEDLLQSSSEGCRVDWYAQSRLGLARTLSEENVYEDIIGKTTASSL